MSEIPEGMHQVTTPPWLVAAVDQRVSMLVDALGGLPPGYSVVMTSLTEPPEDFTKEQYEEWDHSCDNCNKPAQVYGAVNREVDGKKVSITYGACRDCAGKPVDGE